MCIFLVYVLSGIPSTSYFALFFSTDLRRNVYRGNKGIFYSILLSSPPLLLNHISENVNSDRLSWQTITWKFEVEYIQLTWMLTFENLHPIIIDILSSLVKNLRCILFEHSMSLHRHEARAVNVLILNLSCVKIALNLTCASCKCKIDQMNGSQDMQIT